MDLKATPGFMFLKTIDRSFRRVWGIKRDLYVCVFMKGCARDDW